MPRLNASSSRVCVAFRPAFQLCRPCTCVRSACSAEIGERTVLSQGRGRIVQRIAAGIVVDLIAADERVDAHEGFRINRVLITGRDIERDDLLLLILVRLIVRVRNLHPVAGRHQVQVQGILSTGFEVHAVEECSRVADVVHRPKLWRIEKAARPLRVHHQEVAPTRAAEAERGFLADGAERTIVRQLSFPIGF